MIQSRTIAEQVIQQLRLVDDPEFNDALKPTGKLAKLIADGEQALASYLPEAVRAFRIRSDKPLPTEEERRAREYEKVVDTFLERLAVSVKGQSRAIVIYFTSESPDKAARIANALADAYIVAQLDAKLDATRRPINGSPPSCRIFASRSRSRKARSRSTGVAPGSCRARKGR